MNLIYQTYVTDGEIPKFARISRNAFQKYAGLHGAEYMFNDQLTFDTGLKTAPFYERYRIIYDESFDKYDNILYVDSDVYPHDMSSNIFDFSTGLMAMPEHKEERNNFTPGLYIKNGQSRSKYKKFCSHYGLEFDYFEDGQIRFYNSGVLLINREMRIRMRNEFVFFDTVPEEIAHNFDESWFAMNITMTKIPIDHLEVIWNWTGKIKDGIIPDDAKFLHFSGETLKKLMEFDYASEG